MSRFHKKLVKENKLLKINMDKKDNIINNLEKSNKKKSNKIYTLEEDVITAQSETNKYKKCISEINFLLTKKEAEYNELKKMYEVDTDYFNREIQSLKSENKVELRTTLKENESLKTYIRILEETRRTQDDKIESLQLEKDIYMNKEDIPKLTHSIKLDTLDLKTIDTTKGEIEMEKSLNEANEIGIRIREGLEKQITILEEIVDMKDQEINLLTSNGSLAECIKTLEIENQKQKEIIKNLTEDICELKSIKNESTSTEDLNNQLDNIEDFESNTEETESDDPLTDTIKALKRYTLKQEQYTKEQMDPVQKIIKEMDELLYSKNRVTKQDILKFNQKINDYIEKGFYNEKSLDKFIESVDTLKLHFRTLEKKAINTSVEYKIVDEVINNRNSIIKSLEMLLNGKIKNPFYFTMQDINLFIDLFNKETKRLRHSNITLTITNEEATILDEQEIHLVNIIVSINDSFKKQNGCIKFRNK